MRRTASGPLSPTPRRACRLRVTEYAGLLVATLRRAEIASPCEVQVMDGLQGILAAGPAGGVRAGTIAEVCRTPGLVQRGPGLDPVTEGGSDHGRVLREPVGGLTIRPPSRILERLRQIPVVERGDGLDTAGDQPVDEPRVEVDAGLAYRSRTGGNDPGPGDRESVGVQVQARHQVEVLLEAVIVIVGDVPRVTASSRTST